MNAAGIAVLAGCWVGAVLLAGHRCHPPGRLPSTVPPRHRPRRAPLRRHGPAGVAFGVAGLAGAALDPVAMLVVLCGAWALRRWRTIKHRKAQLARRDAAIPDLVDLVATAVAGGHLPRDALVTSIGLAPAEVRPALTDLQVRLDRGERFADALARLPVALGEGIRPLVDALRAHVRDGVPLGPTLDRISTDARRQRRQQAQAAIRRLPVRLSVPLVTCTLSAFILLTVVPLAASTLHSLQGELP
jgi:tight adherence protein C